MNAKRALIFCKIKAKQVPSYSSGTIIKSVHHQKLAGTSHTLDLSALNFITDILWTSSVNLASNAECSSKNLLHSAFQLLRKRLKSHCPSDFNNFVEWNGFTVLNVLLLLSVARGLLQGSDDKR